MNDVLFSIPNQVSEEEVIERVNHYISRAEHASEVFETDKTEGKRLAQELRDDLRSEYKNNEKIKTENFYKTHKLFRNYQSVVQDAFVKTVGSLDKGRKTSGFLFDVQDYMKHHFD